MKRFKKALAFLMAVIMMIGAVNLPVSAATAMSLSLASSGVQDDGNKRYVINLRVGDLDATAISAIGSGKKLTVYYGSDAKGYTSSSRTIYLSEDKIFFTMAYGTYFKEYGYVDSNTVAAELDPMTFWIKAGATIGSNYTVAEDIKIHVDGNTICEESSLTKITLSDGGVSSQDAAGQCLVKYNVSPASAVSGLEGKALTAWVDDAARASYTLSTDSDSLSFPLNYRTLEAGATTAADLQQDHQVEVKAGTIIDKTYIVTDGITHMIDKSTNDDVNSVTLTNNSNTNIRPSNKDYIIYLNGLSTEQVNALGEGNAAKVSTVNIDGKKSGAYGWNVGGALAVIVPWAQFDNAATADAVGRHFVTIPKGATIGSNDEYTVAEDITYLINGNSKPVVVEEFVSLGYDHLWDRGSDYLNYLTGFTAEALDAIGTNSMGHDFADGDLLVDGVSNRDPYLWNLGGGSLALIINPDHLESGITATANLTGEHLVTLRKGTKIGKYTVDRDLILKVSDGKVEWMNPSDAKPTLSIAQSRTDLLLLKVDEIETPLTDVTFEAVNSESVYQYNGTASQMGMLYSPHGGIYADVAGMSGKSAPEAGDVITIKGLWRYPGERKIYDFGITNYSWDGEQWIKGLFVDSTDTAFSITGINRTDVLIVLADKIAPPASGDEYFDAVDESSLYLYNGVAVSGIPTYSHYGGMYLATETMSGGKKTPDVGDKMTISGLWKYRGDGKIYNFGSNVYEWNGSKWVVYVPANDMTLTYVTHVSRDNDWIFYFKPSFAIEESDSETGKDYKHLGNTSVIKINDGTSEVTANNAEIYAFLSGNLGFTITPAQGLPKEPVVGTTVTFPAGLKVTFRELEYATTEAIAFEYDGTKFVEKEVEPEQPEQPSTPQFTLTWGSGYAQDTSEARYMIYPGGATAEQITAFHQKKATIYIDGDPVANGVTFWNDGGKLLLYVRYNKFEDGTATSSSQLKRHTVMLKAGTEVGGYTLSKDFVFTVAQSSVVGGTQDIIFTMRNGGGAQNNVKRYLILLDGATVTQMTDMHNKKAVFYLDGFQTTGASHFYKLNDNDFAFLLYYDDIEAGVTKAEELEPHKITLKKGTQIGGYYVGKTLTIGIHGSSFSVMESESDAELEKMHLKATEGTGYKANGAYTVVATPSYYLPGLIGKTVYKLTVNIGDTPYEVNATKTDKGEFKFTIPASALTNSFTMTVPTAEYTSEDGTYRPITLADYTLYVNAYGYNEKGYLASNGENVATTPASGDASGINLFAADSATVMGASGKPAVRVDDGLSGVYYNGELTDVSLRKTAEGTWHADLAAHSISVVAGDSIILTGSFVKGTEVVDFKTISLTFNGTAWIVNTGVAALPERVVNISEDSFYPVPKNTVINDGAVTSAVLSKSGVYTLKTDIGGAICEREVVLFKKADINADNVMNVLDLIALKKSSLDLKELSKPGVLASDLGGADATEDLKILRAMYLDDIALKADKELPTGIVGQTGAGTYITDVQATKDGTAVYSIADTDNGYKVSSDTYENVGLDYVLDFNVDRDLKILQLTDPQFIDSSQVRTADRLGSSQIEMYKPENFEQNAFHYMRGAIEASNPDVIFITGDLVYGEFDDAGTSFLAFVEFMESFQIPWAPIFGNHDNESMKGVVWQCEQLMNAEYCLFNRRNSIGGNGNYSVGIAKNGSLERVMYLMDTHACWDAIDRGEPVEDRVGFTEAQLDWYRASALHVNSFAGKEVPSFLCYHIPTTEVIKGGYVAGYHNILENQTTFAGNYQIGVDNVAQPGDMGRHEERFKDAYDCAGLLEIMQEVGTDGAFFAHSHRNNISVKYGGVRWTFGLKSSTYDRYPTDLGGVLVTLPSGGGEFTVEQVVVAAP